jgi:hypothetical protein
MYDRRSMSPQVAASLTTEAERLLAAADGDWEWDALQFGVAAPGLALSALAQRLLDACGLTNRIHLDRTVSLWKTLVLSSS